MPSLYHLIIFFFFFNYRYLISFSLALGVLNVIPCIYLDGQWIIKALIEIIVKNRMNNRNKKMIASLLITIGTILLVSCIVLGVYQLFAL